ncbi:MAG: hypothetical protein CVU50_09720 [Candidatus Cloacimonetes bacterium HGW-Cloacimonetes-3]|jgi:hypothetical protein|nr:MAG: hypothetical protein CVU50_09720 [Candidatus Cloacimonetes bacterium HGW-Cloacimonetes-3]
MHKRIVLLLFALLLLSLLPAQNTLAINGLNEAQFVYRTAEDSLNAYFRNSFAINLSYRNFGFGLKYIAELPKYSTQQAELVDELNPNQLELGWKELYATYSKDAFYIHAGTMEESFGNGLSFRSYIDPEFDEDHRLDGFLLKYDDAYTFKAMYGAIESPESIGNYDLAYGADLLAPALYGMRFGASAVTYRTLGANVYNQRDVFSGRMQINGENLGAYAEYASSETYKQTGLPTDFGSAIYANADYSLGKLQLGAAYKKYTDFQYRLHDLAMANYHNETISDALPTGLDEEGWQARAAYSVTECLSVSTDYAEAWDSLKDKQMNDLYVAANWVKDNSLVEASFSHVEKADDAGSYWQKETTPAISLGLPVFAKQVYIKGEFKMAEKQIFAYKSEHYEPKIQADLSFGKLALSLGAQSNWEDFDAIMDSRYWAAVEAKYPVASHSDITIFAGKEAGGKVCRNGVCRYVSAFQGLKVELSTRF